MEFFFGLPILLNIKRGFGALDVFHGTYHPVGLNVSRQFVQERED
jgi:hypothetical protein